MEENKDLFLDEMVKNMKKDIQVIRKRYAIMCPNCFHISTAEIVETHVSSLLTNEANDGYSDLQLHTKSDSLHEISGFCKICSNYVSDFALIDWNIRNIIQKMNKNGFRTKFCCEGHVVEGGYSAPYIILYGQYEDKELFLPESWKIDTEFEYEDEEAVTRISPVDATDKRRDKEAWDDLRNWINSIDNKES